MSYTQGTTHYNLPQTLGDDKRDWFDTNQPFADVDAALYSAYEGVQTLDKDLTAVKSDLNTAQTDIANIKQYDAENTVKVSALETLTAQHTVDIEDVRNDAEDMICSVEEKSATAQYEHLTGAYFRYNDTLYIAIKNINKGDTIVPNENCMTTDVMSSIAHIINDISSDIVPDDGTAPYDLSQGTLIRMGQDLYMMSADVAKGDNVKGNCYISPLARSINRETGSASMSSQNYFTLGRCYYYRSGDICMVDAELYAAQDLSVNVDYTVKFAVPLPVGYLRVCCTDNAHNTFIVGISPDHFRLNFSKAQPKGQVIYASFMYMCHLDGHMPIS